MRLLPLLLLLIAAPAFADSSDYKIGVEGFIDRYQEPGPGLNVNEHAQFGAVTAGYTYNYMSNFVTLEGRASLGNDNYKAEQSGVYRGIRQYETDTRLLTGVKIPVEGGSFIIPFIGLGGRFFYDNSKGVVTTSNQSGYDRRITQFYLPMGISVPIKSGDWYYTPTLEFDPLLWGLVDTRLGNIPGYANVDNTQHHGYGVRGEFTVGQKYKDFSWEVGPFFRYWDIENSGLTNDPTGQSPALLEPRNKRMQSGAGLKLTF